MIHARAHRAILALLAVSSAARADFVRATIKIDVRDASGKPQEAEVTVRPVAGGDAMKVSRVGEVYVTDGVVEGVWTIEVAGAPAERVRVSGRQTIGAVLVLGAAPSERRSRHDRQKHASAPSAAATSSFTVGPDEQACDDKGGAVIEAVAFTRGGLGAGRLEVKRGGRLVCAATVAGGGATLRLPPGDYEIGARFVGGGTAKESYHLRSTQFPPPLIFRAR